MENEAKTTNLPLTYGELVLVWASIPHPDCLEEIDQKKAAKTLMNKVEIALADPTL